MFSELKSPELIFFSAARNSLPRHVCIRFWAIHFFKQIGVSLWLFFNVHRIISEYGLDRLNVHSGPGGVLLMQRVPIPVIVTCHHTYWQQATYIRTQFWKRIFLPLEKRTYRLASRIVCVSADTKRILVDHYHIPEDRITVIHNGVDTDKFYRLSKQPKQKVVLYVGRIDKRKGIEFLIRSMPLVRLQIPDVRLLVGGVGSHLHKMRALVSHLQLEHQVTFLGYIPDDQLNALYNQAQCVVVPSIFEGFGITVIESLAAGTRVIGTNVDGIREILSNEDYGVLVKYGDRSALANSIIAELKDQRQAPQLSSEYMVGRFRDQYQQILA
jgi:glycosyltransferase involved in cell wall biosynthesis